MIQNFLTKWCAKGTEGNYYLQFLAMLTGSLTSVCGGMHHGWPSPSLPQLLNDNSTIPVTSEEGSWIVIMPLIGAIGGSAIGIPILDIIGRKKVILLSCIPYLIAWILIAYAKTVAIIIIARFISGISDAFSLCALPIYVVEIADPRIRGVLGTSVTVLFIFGIFLINPLGSYLSISTSALISSTIPAICLLTFIWMPESPYYLIMKGDIEQASKTLKTLRCTDNVLPDLERITEAVKKQNKASSGKYLDLFTVKDNRKAVGIALVLCGAQQLSGAGAITFYAQIIFEHAGMLSTISAIEASMIYFGVQVIVCVCSSVIVDKVGRRPLLIISIVGSGCALFVEGTYYCVLNKTNINLNSYSWVPLVALIGYVVLFNFGMHTIPAVMLGEIFPTNVKAFALCIMDMYYDLTATVASKFFQITNDSFGLHVPFYTFFMFCVLGLIFIVLFVPETKGKTLEDIQAELVGCDVSGSKACIEN